MTAPHAASRRATLIRRKLTVVPTKRLASQSDLSLVRVPVPVLREEDVHKDEAHHRAACPRCCSLLFPKKAFISMMIIIRMRTYYE